MKKTAIPSDIAKGYVAGYGSFFMEAFFRFSEFLHNIHFSALYPICYKQ